MNPRASGSVEKALKDVVAEYPQQAQKQAIDESPLRKLLNTAIETYLTADLNLLHRNKLRAKEYKAVLTTINDAELANKVFNDIKQEVGAGPLGTSSKLRERLTSALRVHFNITDQEVNSAVRRPAYSVTMYTYSLVLVQAQMLEAVYGLIEKRLNKNIEMETINAPTKK